jgi:two-component system, cell cycle response regulator DivK
MSKLIPVVEDEEDSRKILRDLLSTADYEMTEAENGEEALTAVAKRRPDLILDTAYSLTVRVVSISHAGQM